MSTIPAPWLNPMESFRTSPSSAIARPLPQRIFQGAVPADAGNAIFIGSPRLHSASNMTSMLLAAAMRSGVTVFSLDVGVSSNRLLRQVSILKAVEEDRRIYRRHLVLSAAIARVQDARDADLITKGAAKRKLKRLCRRMEKAQ